MPARSITSVMRYPTSSLIRKLAALAIIASLIAPLATQTTVYAAIAKVGETTAAPTTKVSQFSVNVPAGVQQGHVLIAQIVVQSLSTDDIICTPAGWTSEIRTNNSSNITSQIFWKVASSSEPASYEWRLRESVGDCSNDDDDDVEASVLGGIVAYSGVDTTDPIVASAGGSGSQGYCKVVKVSQQVCRC